MHNTQLDVITFCDYETCPTIKSDNETYTMIVVNPDGRSYANETGTDRSNIHGYESLESHAIGGARY